MGLSTNLEKGLFDRFRLLPVWSLAPLVFASNIMVEPSIMPGWLRTFVGVNPVLLMTSAMRGLMAGTATIEQIGLVLVLVLTMVLAPVTLWLYRRKCGGIAPLTRHSSVDRALTQFVKRFQRSLQLRKVEQ